MVKQRVAEGVEVDLGGQWVGKTHSRLQELLVELNVPTFDSFYKGNGALRWRGRTVYGPMAPTFLESVSFLRNDVVGDDDAHEVKRVMDAFGAIVATIDAEAPWRTPNAIALDRISVSEWLRQVGASALAAFQLHTLATIGGSGGFDLWQVSMLHLAWTQKVAPQTDVPECWLITGCAGGIAERLTNELSTSIFCSAPVTRIAQDDECAYITCRTPHGHHATIRCQAVVVAIPIPLVSRIQFSPPLPPMLTSFAQRSPMGSMIKVLAVYETAFWRRMDRNGFGMSDEAKLVENTADSSPPSGSPGILAGFIGASKAVDFGRLDKAQRHTLVLEDLATMWGEEARGVKHLVLHDWNAEEWTSGAFTSHCSPGTWTTYGTAWGAPFQRVAWAGTDVSHRWPGFFEGAIQSGVDAASHIIRTFW